MSAFVFRSMQLISLKVCKHMGLSAFHVEKTPKVVILS
jgi:hypothetical protein